DVRTEGHAIECRVYAENPARNFLPSPGRLARFAPPDGPEAVRVDTGVREGDQITFHYDPMIAKVIAHGADRDRAADRMGAALDGFVVEGVATNIPFLRRLMDHAAFRAGETHTGFIEMYAGELVQS
ncbi:MAG TPA: 3-methylcrotonyl-CoA carboxylase, partial [Dongiaceae bacterium]|nr:3-methylcrotonyl-CoA carboxylase [Dongiaceae bacterium]